MLDENPTGTPATDAGTGDAPTPPRRRRAASRPAGPPAAVVTPEPVAATPADSTTPADSATPATPPAEKPKRTRTRKKPVAESAQETAVESAPVTADPLPIASTTPEEPAAKPKRTRSRKPKVEVPAEPALVEVAVEESVAASLGALEEKTEKAPPRRRRRVKAETFGVAEGTDPADVLSSLAAAISGVPVADTALQGEAEDAAALEADVPETDAEVDTEEFPEAEEPAAEDEAVEDEDSEASDEDAADGDQRRRRRRRGGRRRRRGGSGGDTDTAEGEEPPAEESESGEESDSSEEPPAEGGSRRRRRRRRRGEEIGEAEDDPTEVVVRVREPRRRSVSDEVTGIEGSTRMEAKKQRRREGRAAGRRRSPILSESEFLARRESVDRAMLIRQAEDYSQLAVLEDGVLVEHYVDRASATSMIGNIYLGKVQNVLPSMEAAFIDIGRGRNAVLYAGEVDWESFGATSSERKVERVFKSGQSVLVQVSKDPVGAKGARLTSHISLPGRYIVYSPGGQLSGISRKLPEPERKRLKGILDDLIDPGASVIVRTAAEGATEDELIRDVNRLKAQWEVLEKKSKTGQAPQQLYAEPDLTVRIIRDLFTEDFTRLVVDGNGGEADAYQTVESYVTHVAPHLAERLERWDRAEKGDIFDSFRVHEQVSKALERKVFLPSGGSLIIDRTEAMTVIDVNTGRFTGSSGNLEATVTSNNLEAAEEVVRQLRLRDIGGIIVIDFIDMVLPNNRELLLRRLVECLGRDRTRHQVAEVTSLGLVQMTRKKIGTGLAEAFTVACETCSGRGYHVHDAPVASQAPSDGGDREGGRRGRGSKRSGGGQNAPAQTQAPASQPAQPRQQSRRTSPAPELASVIAATFASHGGDEDEAPAGAETAPQAPAPELVVAEVPTETATDSEES